MIVKSPKYLGRFENRADKAMKYDYFVLGDV